MHKKIFYLFAMDVIIFVRFFNRPFSFIFMSRVELAISMLRIANENQKHFIEVLWPVVLRICNFVSKVAMIQEKKCFTVTLLSVNIAVGNILFKQMNEIRAIDI